MRRAVPKAWTPTKADLRYVQAQLAGVKNDTYVRETEAAFADFEEQTVRDLVCQLGIVDAYSGARPGVRYEADYDSIGRRLWNRARLELHDALCGTGAGYGEDRKKVRGVVEGGLVTLTPFVMSRLGLPLEMAGVAAVISLIVLKMGLRTICATQGDLRKLEG